MIRTEVLLDYMHRFVGFGSQKAPVWFIGLEQGGGNGLSELERRLEAWSATGVKAFDDFPTHCRLIGDRRWHGAPARIQPTLGKLIRLFLAFSGSPATHVGSAMRTGTLSSRN